MKSTISLMTLDFRENFVPPLWRNVEYSSIYGDLSHAFEHLFQIQSYVTKLTITPGNMINFFGFQRKLQFLNLKTLD
jgi:hypothetical protein